MPRRCAPRNDSVFWARQTPISPFAVHHHKHLFFCDGVIVPEKLVVLYPLGFSARGQGSGVLFIMKCEQKTPGFDTRSVFVGSFPDWKASGVGLQVRGTRLEDGLVQGKNFCDMRFAAKQNGNIRLTKLTDKLVFATLKKCCHCEERSDVAIPLLEGKCTDLFPEEWESLRF